MSTEVRKPQYYKAQWHNCMKCRIHYMSEQPHLRAYLCDDCWKKMPHYRAHPKTVIRRQQKPARGPTYNLPHILSQITFLEALLYIAGNGLCLLIVAYYLWFR